METKSMLQPIVQPMVQPQKVQNCVRLQPPLPKLKSSVSEKTTISDFRPMPKNDAQEAVRRTCETVGFWCPVSNVWLVDPDKFQGHCMYISKMIPVWISATKWDPSGPPNIWEISILHFANSNFGLFSRDPQDKWNWDVNLVEVHNSWCWEFFRNSWSVLLW